MVDNERIAFSHGRLRTNYSVVMRKTDSSPLTTLGDGNVESLSPDGAWLAAQIAAPPGVALYPTGPGTARQLDPGPIVQFHNTYWYPDSEYVFIIGNEAGGPAVRRDVFGSQSPAVPRSHWKLPVPKASPC